MSGKPRDNDRSSAYPLAPDCPHCLQEDAPPRFMLVDLSGRAEAELEKLIETTRSGLAEKGLVPVFVTDALDFELFRRKRVIFESLPPLAETARLAPDLDWGARRVSLRAFIQSKWDPVGEIDLSRGNR